MKTKIHPKYYSQAKAQCACGAQYTLGSTKEKIEIEVCGRCHPFYTGKDKIVDKSGMVERYRQRLLRVQKKTAKKKRPKKMQKLGKHV